MRGSDFFGAGAVGKIEREQQAAARLGVIRGLGEARAERLDCVSPFTAGEQRQGEV